MLVSDKRLYLDNSNAGTFLYTVNVNIIMYILRVSDTQVIKSMPTFYIFTR